MLCLIENNILEQILVKIYDVLTWLGDLEIV